MNYRFDDREVRSVSDLLTYLRDDYEAVGADPSTQRLRESPVIWFRGLPSRNRALLPTLYRGNIAQASERNLMNKFKQNAYQFLGQRPQGEWEWLLLARHHGLPSRLLDWTESPAVGLFFSCGEDDRPNASPTGVLWCLLPVELNGLANIRTTTESHFPPMMLDDGDMTDQDRMVANYSAASVARTSSRTPISPAAAMSIRTNARIQAQQGVFTIHHAKKLALEKWGNGSHLWRYLIPKKYKSVIRQQLRWLGITERTLFPELDSVANEAQGGF